MANPRDIYQDPNFSDPQVYGPPAPTGQAQPRSLLDILRERTTRELEGERLARLQEFGAGMLASGSPNFFTNLAAGTRAQAEGERSRTDRLRQVAEAERQARAQQAEEQYRRDQLEIERQRRDYERDPRNPRNVLYGAQADYYRQGGRGTGAGGQLTERDIATIGDRANRFAASQVREPTPGSPEAVRDTPEARETRAQQRADIARQYIAEQYRLLGRPVPDAVQAPPADVRAPPAPAAVIDLRRNPGGNPPR